MTDHISQTTRLYNGVEMPWLGLGVHKAKEGSEVENAVRVALDAGYRSIDTATLYGNETGVGRAIRQSGIKREELFIATKIWNTDQGYESTFRAVETSLNKLQTDYLDLYLIHWPLGQRSVESWKAMEKLYEKGKLRAIGVSNFLIPHLQSLMAQANVKPMVNQYEFHPKLTQPALYEFCREQGIQPEAWRPIMKGEVNEVPLLNEMASKYRKTPVQLVLRWDLQKGVVTIPKSVHPERIRSNADIFDFQIEEEDMKRIDSLNANYRLGDDPNDLETLFRKYGNP
ncbi:MAG: aldo/keto reductase [Prolixibacteraceae bacterium]|jgi:diketogulonate reductase-like aldo/keto reductase|nr:aldo/keto reductase [Prolixibacteraceae bacterium]